MEVKADGFGATSRRTRGVSLVVTPAGGALAELSSLTCGLRNSARFTSRPPAVYTRSTPLRQTVGRQAKEFHMRLIEGWLTYARSTKVPATGRDWGRFGALALAGTLALALSAKIQIPFYPVPMTLQTLAVLAIGGAFGLRLASATVALYLLEGVLGLPVFAGVAAGPAYMAGPTGGYLVGFFFAAALIGALADRGLLRTWLGLTLVMSLGHVVMFAFGFGWLALAIGATKAWAVGVAPFYAATIVKTALAVALFGATRAKG